MLGVAIAPTWAEVDRLGLNEIFEWAVDRQVAHRPGPPRAGIVRDCKCGRAVECHRVASDLHTTPVAWLPVL